ncbi:MAG: hypothetical protein OXR64_09940 [Chloroflexota bacterium]|nr:hypothetical protein [Chloroflexota bacterium]MDE2920152.1 hypothetical protein [Chloroflexota bacterium]
MDPTPIVVTIGSVGAAMLVAFIGAAFRLGAMPGTIQEQVEAIPQLRQDVHALAGRVDVLTERVSRIEGVIEGVLSSRTSPSD